MTDDDRDDGDRQSGDPYQHETAKRRYSPPPLPDLEELGTLRLTADGVAVE